MINAIHSLLKLHFQRHESCRIAPEAAGDTEMGECRARSRRKLAATWSTAFEGGGGGGAAEPHRESPGREPQASVLTDADIVCHYCHMSGG